MVVRTEYSPRGAQNMAPFDAHSNAAQWHFQFNAHYGEALVSEAQP
jgi:hypothetical protein